MENIIYGVHEHCIGDSGFIAFYFSTRKKAELYLIREGYIQLKCGSFGSKEKKMTANIITIELDEALELITIG